MVSFGDVRGDDILVTILLLVVWSLTGYPAGRLVFRRTIGRLRLGAYANLALLTVAELLVVAKLFVL